MAHAQHEGVRAFVREHYPEYLAAYETMPRNIEKVDFFRYLVVLHHGGIYADTDVECRQPLDSWIDVDATFIAGVENEFVNAAQASHNTPAPTRRYATPACMLHGCSVHLLRLLLVRLVFGVAVGDEIHFAGGSGWL